MNAIDEYPPASLALRAKLPTISTTTAAGLVKYGLTQPGSMPWLLRRTAAYWETFPCPRGEINPHSQMLDATAALDLLKWRIGATSDAEAVGHLKAPL